MSVRQNNKWIDEDLHLSQVGDETLRCNIHQQIFIRKKPGAISTAPMIRRLVRTQSSRVCRMCRNKL